MKKLVILLIAASFFIGCKSEKSVNTEIQTGNFTISVTGDTTGSITIDGNNITLENNSGNIDVKISN